MKRLIAWTKAPEGFIGGGFIFGTRLSVTAAIATDGWGYYALKNQNRLYPLGLSLETEPRWWCFGLHLPFFIAMAMYDRKGGAV